MYVLEVIPIAGSAHKDTLTYFSKTDVGLGTIIKVPLRDKSIPALVIGSEDARDLKSTLKGASFELRKVEGKAGSKKFFSSEFIEAASKTADYFAVNLGAVLGSVAGQAIFTNILSKSNVPNMPTFKKDGPTNSKGGKNQTFAIQGSESDRLSAYKSRIRQAFALKQSVVFCVPTTDYADYVKTHIAKGLEDFTFILHGSISPKKFASTWQEIHKTKPHL
jgi:primosomal protein N'